MSEEGAPESSGCAGVVVVSAVALGAAFGTHAISRDLFILTVGAIAWGAVLWVAWKPVPCTSDPAPPPGPEGVVEAKPQVNMVRDTDHPNRWVVTRPSHWLGREINKEAGTT